MLTELQKKTAQAIVNIFETGVPHGEYGQVTLLPGDSGHLTYGRSQTTLASGNLHLLLKTYVEAAGAAKAADLTPFLGRLAAGDLSLDHDQNFHRLLREAGDDPIMRQEQDTFFDRVYWAPSVRAAASIGLSTSLGVATIYDSRIHGSWKRMRDRTIDGYGPVSAVGEREWVKRYVETRRAWLAGHSNRLLQRTVYRMDAFRKLINESKWDLPLPLAVRGVFIDEDVLAGATVRASAEDGSERTLSLRTPRLTGDDVEELQRELNRAGFSLQVDGVFGPSTEAAVRRFQQRNGLTADGIAGPATLSLIEGEAEGAGRAAAASG